MHKRESRNKRSNQQQTPREHTSLKLQQHTKRHASDQSHTCKLCSLMYPYTPVLIVSTVASFEPTTAASSSLTRHITVEGFRVFFTTTSPSPLPPAAPFLPLAPFLAAPPPALPAFGRPFGVPPAFAFCGVRHGVEGAVRGAWRA